MTEKAQNTQQRLKKKK